MVRTAVAHREAKAVPHCPRCGYDQRGVVASWSDCCPLEGTCTECGLRLSWAEMIVPAKFEPPWCVEFVRGRWRLPRGCVATLMRSVRPFRFWSQLKMSQRIKWRRLVLYLMFLVLPLVLTYVILQGGAAAYLRYSIQRSLISHQQALQAQLPILQASLTQAPTDPAWNSDPEALKAWQAATAQQIARIQLLTTGPPKINHTYFNAIIEAILFPSRNFSWGTITYGTTVVGPYPPPASIYDSLFGSVTPNAFEPIVHQGASIVSIIMLLLLLPASLALLPASRRRAKVRWAHIIRVTIYSAWILTTSIIVATLATVLILWDAGPLSLWVFEHSILLGWLLLPLWWVAAIRNYLRMPHAWGVVGLLTLMLMLLISPLLLFVMPKWLVEVVLG